MLNDKPLKKVVQVVKAPRLMFVHRTCEWHVERPLQKRRCYPEQLSTSKGREEQCIARVSTFAIREWEW